MSESSMYGTLRRVLKGMDPVRVENRVGPGTPDINYVSGWIEAKWMRRWPDNADESPVLFPKFFPQQRVWLKRRWLAGGEAWLLLQVGKDWLLFDGDTASWALGRLTKSGLYERAWDHWVNKLDGNELIVCLTSRKANVEYLSEEDPAGRNLRKLDGERLVATRTHPLSKIRERRGRRSF